MSPDTLILLANLGRPRRPSGTTEPHSEAALPNAATAARQLATLTHHKVSSADLPDLRRVQHAAIVASEALIARKPLNWQAINALACASTARALLITASDGTPQRQLSWRDPTVSAYLARRLIEEIAAIDAERLRHCARRECGLVFYDDTRSRTRRWHAEDPCGWRERQRHHRAAPTRAS